jgi:hypothetical protein
MYIFDKIYMISYALQQLNTPSWGGGGVSQLYSPQLICNKLCEDNKNIEHQNSRLFTLQKLHNAK